ncbi:DUF6477 family protein [Paracoccus tegillarcae]|uniref:DUF6477 family protein n=1 Tax=Paracoccus tegillarcae TaxID=1529068 RepID=UPI0018E69A2A|nr:DUF6477 family protein [Paracoccus tegillarcae]
MTAMPNVIAFRAPPTGTPLRRPRVLISAARAGQSSWRRERDLPRLLRSDGCPRPGIALPRLRAEEARMNAARLEAAAEYDLHRHVTLMIAILAEMRQAVEDAPIAVDARAVEAARQAADGLARITCRETTNPAHP